MGTLYIDRKEIHIKLDGQALAFYAGVTREGILPINPLKRVIIVGNVTLDTPVLHRLLDNREEGKAGRRIPARLIGRVFIIGNISLALDLCHILEPEAEIQCLQFIKVARENGYLIKEKGTWRATKDGMKDIIHRFENRRKQIHDNVERLIDDLFELMRGLRK